MTFFALPNGDEVVCPGEVCHGEYGDGCCTKIGLQCCPDGLYCVKDAKTMCGSEGSPPKPYGDEMPAKTLAAKRSLLSLKDTNCPNGICEEDGWFCCDDGLYCAETENDCPGFKRTAKKLVGNSLLHSLKDTPCPNGTCEEDGWFCCNDGLYCAETEPDCPGFKEGNDILALY